MTKSKLDTRLEPRFTDYSIKNYKPDYNGKKKITVKIYDSGIKGLKLNCVNQAIKGKAVGPLMCEGG